jgi:hypothetical protein
MQLSASHLPLECLRANARRSGREQVLRDVGSALTRIFDVTVTKDVANCSAKADVKVDDRVLLRDIPVTYLLFLGEATRRRRVNELLG